MPDSQYRLTIEFTWKQEGVVDDWETWDTIQETLHFTDWADAWETYEAVKRAIPPVDWDSETKDPPAHCMEFTTSRNLHPGNFEPHERVHCAPATILEFLEVRNLLPDKD